MSLNKKMVISNNAHESFLAVGHIYGSPRHHATQYPSPSIIANVNTINQSGVNFFIGLGDIVNGPTKQRFDIFDEVFLSKLEIPFYN